MSNPLIYLASHSPRRRTLLMQLGVAHEVILIDIDETPHAGETPELYVARMALEKACAGRTTLSAVDRPVLGADTSVVIDGEILGKPRDEEDARLMLRRLSGRAHLVISAVALVNAATEESCLSVSRVVFGDISDEAVCAYWQTGEPADKAGGYAIQGRAAMFVKRLEGSYSGVMGLPLFETAALLRGFGILLPVAGAIVAE